MSLWCQGRWEELSLQCRECVNRRITSLRMDGNHIYGCGTYPLKRGDKCPRFEQDLPKEEA